MNDVGHVGEPGCTKLKLFMKVRVGLQKPYTTIVFFFESFFFWGLVFLGGGGGGGVGLVWGFFLGGFLGGFWVGVLGGLGPVISAQQDEGYLLEFASASVHYTMVPCSSRAAMGFSL